MTELSLMYQKLNDASPSEIAEALRYLKKDNEVLSAVTNLKTTIPNIFATDAFNDWWRLDGSRISQPCDIAWKAWQAAKREPVGSLDSTSVYVK